MEGQRELLNESLRELLQIEGLSGSPEYFLDSVKGQTIFKRILVAGWVFSQKVICMSSATSKNGPYHTDSG
jgi:hypothetical protein